jgi:hypothetical protein
LGGPELEVGNSSPNFLGFPLLPLQSSAIVEGFATDAVLQIAGVMWVGLLVFWVLAWGAGGVEESLVLSCRWCKNRYIIRVEKKKQKV